MSVPQPPKFPWAKGNHESYGAVVVEVHVCKDEHHRVFSMHQLQGPLDRETALKWPSGGQEQVAYALLMETLRREAMLEILIRMSKEPTLPARLLTMTEDERGKVTTEMVDNLKSQINTVMDRLAVAAVHEAMREITTGL